MISRSSDTTALTIVLDALTSGVADVWKALDGPANPGRLFQNPLPSPASTKEFLHSGPISRVAEAVIVGGLDVDKFGQSPESLGLVGFLQAPIDFNVKEKRPFWLPKKLSSVQIRETSQML